MFITENETDGSSGSFKAMQMCFMFYSLKSVQLIKILRTVALQVPLLMGFPRQELWCGVPHPPPRDLPGSRTEPVSPALAEGVYTTEPQGKPSGFVQQLNFAVVAGRQPQCVNK